MKKFHIHNANADEVYEAKTMAEALKMFREAHPEEAHNALFAQEVK